MRHSFKVLVVDDDEPLAELLARMLTRAGYLVDVVGDGDQAIRAMNALCFSAVVTDLMMPNRPGVEAIRHIRNRWPETKIVAISGAERLSKGDLLDLARTMGADVAIQKPVAAEELVAVLDGLLLIPDARGAVA